MTTLILTLLLVPPGEAFVPEVSVAALRKAGDAMPPAESGPVMKVFDEGARDEDELTIQCSANPIQTWSDAESAFAQGRGLIGRALIQDQACQGCAEKSTSGARCEVRCWSPDYYYYCVAGQPGRLVPGPQRETLEGARHWARELCRRQSYGSEGGCSVQSCHPVARPLTYSLCP